MDVLGAAAGVAGGVRVGTHASGSLNGTFAIAGNATVRAGGTFSSDAAETWEGADYLTVASNTSTGYAAQISAVITVSLTTNLWVNTTTVYGPLPPFNLGVGGSASIAARSNVSAVASFSAFGAGQRVANRTVQLVTWTRTVLGLENVTVGAGTFSAYRMNQSLGNFPGLGIVGSLAGANETAWFSNDTGYYVKRVAYVNGTPVAEMDLKSYAYPAGPSGLPLPDTILLLAIPVALAILVVFLFLRRRKARGVEAKGSSGVGPVGELPPKESGGRP